ncbi:DUF4147 domain-containing protein [bacterium]|nr:DUF4147 domain-containing protein [bacterium]
MGCTTDVLTIFNAAVDYVRPEAVCMRTLAWAKRRLFVTDQLGRRFQYDLSPYRRIVILGAGKAARGMAAGVASIIPSELPCTGAVISPLPGSATTGGVRILPGAHPCPDDSSLAGGRVLLEEAARVQTDDFVIFLLSGGASSLFTALVPGIPISRYNRIIAALSAKGANIREINAVRTIFSQVKGGKFADLLGDAPVLTLAISDVPGDDPAVIGSGPTVHSRNHEQGIKILDKYRLYNRLTKEMLNRAGINALAREERAGKPPQNRYYHILAGNRTALQGAAIAAAHLGYTVSDDHKPWNCRVDHAAAFFVRKIAALQAGRQTKICLLTGGETTVRVSGNGIGGRNQELSLRVLTDAPSLDGIGFLSAGTDGIDGNSDAAGASIDASVKANALKTGLDPRQFLSENNSNGFFRKAGGLVLTGPTGTNVMDIQILLSC